MIRNFSLTLNKTHDAGFTLIEVLIALAIVGMILALVPPTLTNATTNAQLKSTTRLLVSGLQQARSQAVSRQKETAFMLNVRNNLFSVEGKTRYFNLPKDTLMELIAADTEIVTEKEAVIRFFPDGSSTGGRIKLSTDRKQFIIDVNWLTGKIHISP